MLSVRHLRNIKGKEREKKKKKMKLDTPSNVFSFGCLRVEGGDLRIEHGTASNNSALLSSASVLREDKVSYKEESYP